MGLLDVCGRGLAFSHSLRASLPAALRLLSSSAAVPPTDTAESSSNSNGGLHVNVEPLSDLEGVSVLRWVVLCCAVFTPLFGKIKKLCILSPYPLTSRKTHTYTLLVSPSLHSLTRMRARNAIGRQLLRELVEAMNLLRTERTTRCVVLRRCVVVVACVNTCSSFSAQLLLGSIVCLLKFLLDHSLFSLLLQHRAQRVLCWS